MSFVEVRWRFYLRRYICATAYGDNRITISHQAACRNRHDEQLSIHLCKSRMADESIAQS